MSAVGLVEASTFTALGEPSRLRIVELLRDGPMAVGSIVERLGLRQPQVSKHLRVLAEAGIVDVDVRHRHRIYRLRADNFHAVARWVDSFEQLWETRLDNLGTLLESLGTDTDTDSDTDLLESSDSERTADP